MKMGECGEGEKEEWEGKGKEREGRRIIRKQSGEGQRVRQREGKKVGQEQTEWRDGQRECVCVGERWTDSQLSTDMHITSRLR